MDQLSKNTISTLNDLIECCKDGEYGFRASAEQVQDASLKVLLATRAGECQAAASELQALVVQCGDPEGSGSAMGAMHRGWVAVKGTLAGYTDLAVLEETERGEDSALATYRKALQQELPTSVHEVVQRQYTGVKRNHDQIRSLRDRARATPG